MPTETPASNGHVHSTSLIEHVITFSIFIAVSYAIFAAVSR